MFIDDDSCNISYWGNEFIESKVMICSFLVSTMRPPVFVDHFQCHMLWMRQQNMAAWCDQNVELCYFVYYVEVLKGNDLPFNSYCWLL